MFDLDPEVVKLMKLTFAGILGALVVMSLIELLHADNILMTIVGTGLGILFGVSFMIIHMYKKSKEDIDE